MRYAIINGKLHSFGVNQNHSQIFGEDLYIKLIIIEFIHTDLPEPVAPAISIWGILERSVTTFLPVMSLPKQKDRLDLAFSNTELSIISRSFTTDTFSLGISMPIAAFPVWEPLCAHPAQPKKALCHWIDW